MRWMRIHKVWRNKERQNSNETTIWSALDQGITLFVPTTTTKIETQASNDTKDERG